MQRLGCWGLGGPELCGVLRVSYPLGAEKKQNAGFGLGNEGLCPLESALFSLCSLLEQLGVSLRPCGIPCSMPPTLLQLQGGNSGDNWLSLPTAHGDTHTCMYAQ